MNDFAPDIAHHAALDARIEGSGVDPADEADGVGRDLAAPSPEGPVAGGDVDLDTWHG